MRHPVYRAQGIPERMQKIITLFDTKIMLDTLYHIFHFTLSYIVFYFQTPDLLSNDVKSQSYSTKTKTSVSSNGIKKSFNNFLLSHHLSKYFRSWSQSQVPELWREQQWCEQCKNNRLSKVDLNEETTIFFWKQPIYGLISILENLTRHRTE